MYRAWSPEAWSRWMYYLQCCRIIKHRLKRQMAQLELKGFCVWNMSNGTAPLSNNCLQKYIYLFLIQAVLNNFYARGWSVLRFSIMSALMLQIHPYLVDVTCTWARNSFGWDIVLKLTRMQVHTYAFAKSCRLVTIDMGIRAFCVCAPVKKKIHSNA